MSLSNVCFLLGIVCMDHLEEILQFVRPSDLKKENKWVVQKYIGKCRYNNITITITMICHY